MADTPVKPTISWGPLVSEQAGTSNRSDTFKPEGLIDYTTLNRKYFANDVEFNEFYRSIKDFCMARLGYPVVRVELEDFQIMTAIDEAISKLDYHAPDWCTSVIGFETSSTHNLYELPEYIMNNVRYVAYKKDLLSVPFANGSLESDLFIRYFQDNFIFTDFSISEFYILQMWLKSTRKVLGREGSFKIMNGKYIWVSPSPGASAKETVIVEYKSLNTNTLHHAFINWLQRYSLCVCKEILGQIRSKYDVLPSPDGGARLNGAALIQEAQKEKEDLIRVLVEEVAEPPMFSTY